MPRRAPVPPPSARYHSVCPHDCPDTCGCLTEVADGRAVSFRADPGHPVTRGWLCAKVDDYLDLVYHPERVLTPLRRTTPKHRPPRFEPLSWDAALETIAKRWQASIRRHGPESILPYSYSGTLGLVQMSVASTRLWDRLGTSRLERSICGAAAELAVKATLGARRSPPYQHVAHSRLCILWGHNPVSTAPHFMPFLREAQRNGCEVVVIDPLRTRTARSADLHLAPRPGTDAALALALAHVLLRDGLHDAQWLARSASGFDEFAERARQFPPARAAAICGLEAPVIEALAHRYAAVRPGLIKIADGINRNRNGGQSVRAICALPALTGQYGTLGGGLAYSTSDTIAWDREALAPRAGCPAAGREVNMNRLGAALAGELDGAPIENLYVFGANPACSTPNSNLIVQGLQREDLFTVAHELFLTDTARLADIVLPATTQLEHVDLHRGYGHHRLAYNARALAPRGEARSNWDAQRAIAAAMGIDAPALREDPDTIIAQVIEASRAHNAGLEGIDLERLRREGSVALAGADDVPFAEGRFATPDGRVALRSDLLAALGADPLPGWRDVGDPESPPDGCTSAAALALVSPAAHHFVSSSFANRQAMVRREGSRPRLELNREDAERSGVRDGDPVRVFNRRGACVLEARVGDAVRPGVAATTKGWWRVLDGDQNINQLTCDALGDLAGQSTFHSTRVWIEPLSDSDAPAHGSRS